MSIMFPATSSFRCIGNALAGSDAQQQSYQVKQASSLKQSVPQVENHPCRFEQLRQFHACDRLPDSDSNALLAVWRIKTREKYNLLGD